MRVNIAYSIDLEDVPKEVARLLEECQDTLTSISTCLDITADEEPLEMVEGLDKTRIQLAKLDMKLGDCMNILSGYVQTLARKPILEQAPPPPLEVEGE